MAPNLNLLHPLAIVFDVGLSEESDFWKYTLFYFMLDAFVSYGLAILLSLVMMVCFSQHHRDRFQRIWRPADSTDSTQTRTVSTRRTDSTDSTQTRTDYTRRTDSSMTIVVGEQITRGLGAPLDPPGTGHGTGQGETFIERWGRRLVNSTRSPVDPRTETPAASPHFPDDHEQGTQNNGSVYPYGYNAWYLAHDTSPPGTPPRVPPNPPEQRIQADSPRTGQDPSGSQADSLGTGSPRIRDILPHGNSSRPNLNVPDYSASVTRTLAPPYIQRSIGDSFENLPNLCQYIVPFPVPSPISPDPIDAPTPQTLFPVPHSESGPTREDDDDGFSIGKRIFQGDSRSISDRSDSCSAIHMPLPRPYVENMNSRITPRLVNDAVQPNVTNNT